MSGSRTAWGRGGDLGGDFKIYFSRRFFKLFLHRTAASKSQRLKRFPENSSYICVNLLLKQKNDEATIYFIISGM
jgi:hypothetical protein